LVAMLTPGCILAGGDGFAGTTQIPVVRVFVINSAGVDEKTLSATLDRAGRIFGEAGLKLRWLRCPASLGGRNDAGCRSDDLNVLVLRIVHRPPKTYLGQEALGFAVSSQEDSVYASVFLDRVLAMVPLGGRCSASVLLGHVIAHELGHLMLANPAHARHGLMAASWNAADLQLAAGGLLQFSVAEAERMRAGAIRRDLQLEARASNK